MNKKLLLKIAIFLSILSVCWWIAAQTNERGNSENPENLEEGGEDRVFTYGELQEQEPQTPEGDLSLPGNEKPGIREEYFPGYDEDVLSRKIFQEKLPPLDKKEKIAWAFRMAKKNIFL